MNAEISTDETLEGGEDSAPWKSHPIDIRISLPFLHTRYYFTVVAGRERRPAHRRKEERKDYPIVTLGNAMFALGVTTLFALLGVAIIIARSAIIEY